LDAQKVGLE